MTETNNTINILQLYLKKIENVYKRILHSNDIDSQKYGYAVGKGAIIITVLKNDDALTIQVFDEMPLENVEYYLYDRSFPGIWRGFPHKSLEEVREILEKLCGILLETPANCIDAKAVKQKVMEAEFACHQKYHPISEQTMQSMKFDAERAAQNMLLKKG